MSYSDSMRLRRLKPGSLTRKGSVVGLCEPIGDPFQVPVVVPSDFGVAYRVKGRIRALELAGWVMCPAALQPRLLNRNEACLIHRNSNAYQRWQALSPERKRAGAGR